MLDFWFTFGALLVDDPQNNNSALLNQIDQALTTLDANPATPVFTQQTAKLVLGGQRFVPANWGVLNQAACEAIRHNIRQLLPQALPHIAPPPISLYTAAKLGQLWKTSPSNLLDGVKLGGQAFQTAKAAQPIQPSYNLLTLMGACFVDDNLAATLSQNNDTLSSEFGVSRTTPEWGFMQRLLGTTSSPTTFSTAYQKARDGWGNCTQLMMWYSDFQHAANE